MASPFLDKIAPSLLFESERLKTFFEHKENGRVKIWSSLANITPEELAKDGFYFLKKKDYCACVFCGAILGEWEEGDTARGEHQRFRGKHQKEFCPCPFIGDEPVGNIPMSLCEHLEPMWRETVVERLKNRNKNQSIVSPDFSFPENREVSFESSPLSMEMRKKMSAAGFYRLSISDHVRCFRCGLGLGSWSDSMDPLEIHAKYSPDCIVVKLSENPFVAKTNHEEVEYDREEEVNDKLVDLVTEQGDIEMYVARMGFSLDVLKAVVKDRLLEEGIKFYSVTDCLEGIVVFMERKLRRKLRTGWKLDPPHKGERVGVDTVGTNLDAEPGNKHQDLALIWRQRELLYEPIRPEAEVQLLAISETNLPDPETPQKEQRQEPRHEAIAAAAAAAAAVTGTTDLHRPPITEGCGSIDMEAEKESCVRADETTKKLSEGSLTEEEAEVVEDKEEIPLYYACKICLYEEANVVLKPCRHLCTCSTCTAPIGACPVCRTKINDVEIIYRS